MGRRAFNREFKLEAVKLVLERGMSAAQLARDLWFLTDTWGISSITAKLGYTHPWRDK